MRIRTGFSGPKFPAAVPETLQAFMVGDIGFIADGVRSGYEPRRRDDIQSWGPMIWARRVDGYPHGRIRLLAPEWVRVRDITVMGQTMPAGHAPSLEAAMAEWATSLLAAPGRPREHDSVEVEGEIVEG